MTFIVISSCEDDRRGAPATALMKGTSDPNASECTSTSIRPSGPIVSAIVWMRAARAEARAAFTLKKRAVTPSVLRPSRSSWIRGSCSRVSR